LKEEGVKVLYMVATMYNTLTPSSFKTGSPSFGGKQGDRKGLPYMFMNPSM